MRIAWSNVSYHMAFRDKSRAAVGESRDIPSRYTEPGYGMVVTDIVQGVSCEEIAAVSLLYFGYYPIGLGQMQVNPSLISTSIE